MHAVKEREALRFPLQLHISYENEPQTPELSRSRALIRFSIRATCGLVLSKSIQKASFAENLDLKVPEPMRAQAQLGTSIQTRMDAAKALGKLGGNMSNVPP